MALDPGVRLGPYQVVSALGTGGTGEVYKARDTRLDRTVAVKVLRGEFAGDPESRARFEREARAVAALDHPHICGIYDVGSVDGTHYLVMPHLEGQTLASRLGTSTSFGSGFQFPIRRGSVVPSAADHITVVDRPADQGPGASSDDRAKCLRSAGSDDVAEDGAADAADDQAGGAVVVAAVVAVVGAPVDAIVSAQPPRAVTTIVAFVVPGRIPVAVARFNARGDARLMPTMTSGYRRFPLDLRRSQGTCAACGGHGRTRRMTFLCRRSRSA